MLSFGAELRRERELREITLREVAEATKINLRYLEALEQNDFEHLPGGVFNRGFVRAYCQFIGVDPETMINAYILEERAQDTAGGGADPRLLRGPAAAAPQRTAPPPAPATRQPADKPVRRRYWWALLLLLAVGLLAAAAVYYYVTMSGTGSSAAPRAAVPAAGAPKAEPS